MRSFSVKKYLNLMLILGIISLLLFSIDFIRPFLTDYLKGFFMSFGVSLILVALVMGKNKKYLAKSELEAKDERMVMIREKTFTAGYYFHMILTVFGIIGFGFFEETMVVSTILAGLFLIETIFNSIIGSVYMKKF